MRPLLPVGDRVPYMATQAAQAMPRNAITCSLTINLAISDMRSFPDGSGLVWEHTQTEPIRQPPWVHNGFPLLYTALTLAWVTLFRAMLPVRMEAIILDMGSAAGATE